MPNIIKETAIEKGSFKIKNECFDESGNAIPPDSLSWTLTDIKGVEIINSREEVPIITPAEENIILLYGDDLAIDNKEKTDRVILFEGTYTSGDFGASIPIKDEAVFTIIPLTKAGI